ncbi:MAG TPA: ABC transporter ATP-binding protein [Rhodobacteraceae bacterium]|nr:ABC transporter ATP-binding protein [Paracoccaceae bacterium]
MRGRGVSGGGDAVAAPGDPAVPFVIDVEGLTKSFGGRTVVNGVSIRVRKGHVFGFLGPNGSGKTTTMRLICGLLTPDSGRGSCLGFDIHDSDHIKPNLGYMTQHFSLYRDLSVKENLDFVAGIYNIPDAAGKVAATMRRMGLQDRRDQIAATLSGGWKQRLALASCLLHDPKLLLLDEPTAGVDPQARREFWNQIHSLTLSGITVLVSTHYMDEAERCSELAFILKGNILTHGTLDEVIAGSHLSSWVVTGRRLDALAEELEQGEGIDIVTRFGASLHVSGHDPVRLEQALEPFMARPDHDWRRAAPTLEDVFIQLMEQKHDQG